MRGLDLLQQQPVRLEQRRQLAGVDPPAGEHLAAHPVALVDQPLDGVGDLELAARRRLDRARPRRGSSGRTGTRRPAPGRSAGRPASRPGGRRCRSRRARRCRTGAGRAPASAGSARTAARAGDRASSNACDERAEILLEQVVAEVHHEVVVTEEVVRDRARSGPGRAARPAGCT